MQSHASLRLSQLPHAVAGRGLAGLLLCALSTLPHPVEATPAAAPRPAAAATGARDRHFPKPVALAHVRRVVLDPGHGGANLGTLGYHGTQEKVLTLKISRYVADFVHKHSNVTVLLTRHDDRDIALRDRPRWANARKADALISLHCNANPKPDPRGMEIWFLSSETSVELAQDIVREEEGLPEEGPAAALPWSVDGILAEMQLAQAHELSESLALSLATGLRRGRPGARFRGVKQAPFAVLKEAQMPAVVFEVGYLSHKAESLELLQPQTHLELARGVLHGLVAFDRLLARRAPPGSGGPGASDGAHDSPNRSKAASTSASASRSLAPSPSPPSRASRGAPSGPRSTPRRRPSR